LAFLFFREADSLKMENFYANLYAPLPISPEAVLKLAECSQLAQVVAAACRLQIFEALTEWLSASDLARQKNLDAVTTARLLEVLKHLGYVEGSNGLYKNCLLYTSPSPRD